MSGLGYVVFFSCTGSQSDKVSVDSISTIESPLTDSILYRVAEGYFASSNPLPTTITSEEELSRYMGMATTMMEARPLLTGAVSSCSPSSSLLHGFLPKWRPVAPTKTMKATSSSCTKSSKVRISRPRRCVPS